MRFSSSLTTCYLSLITAFRFLVSDDNRTLVEPLAPSCLPQTSNFNRQTSSLMDPFSYLFVLISIILAERRASSPVLAKCCKRVHAGGSIGCTLSGSRTFSCIWWWRGGFLTGGATSNRGPFFLHVCAYLAHHLVSCFTAALPRGRAQLTNHSTTRLIFYANHRAFFILVALYGPVDLVDTLLKGTTHFFALGPAYVGSLILFVTGLTVAAITRNARYHQCFAIFFLAQTILISFAFFHTLI